MPGNQVEQDSEQSTQTRAAEVAAELEYLPAALAQAAGSRDRQAVRDLAVEVTELLDRAAVLDEDAVPAREAGAELQTALIRLRFLALYYLIEVGDSAPQAIAIGEPLAADLDRILGPDHPDTLNARNSLAAAYLATGRAAEAIPLFKRTLISRERVLGPEHRDTLISQNNLAIAYEDAGRIAEAILLFRLTVAAKEKLFGSLHPSTVNSLGNLANAYRSAGRIAEAIPLFEQTLATRERLLGPDHPDTQRSRDNLARALRKQDQLAEPVPPPEPAPQPEPAPPPQQLLAPEPVLPPEPTPPVLPPEPTPPVLSPEPVSVAEPTLLPGLISVPEPTPSPDPVSLAEPTPQAPQALQAPQTLQAPSPEPTLGQGPVTTADREPETARLEPPADLSTELSTELLAELLGGPPAEVSEEPPPEPLEPLEPPEPPKPQDPPADPPVEPRAEQPAPPDERARDQSGRKSKRRRFLGGAAVILILLAAGGLALAHPWSHSGNRDASTDAARAAGQPGARAAAAAARNAAAWVSQHVSRTAVVACDPAMCTALKAEGMPAASLLTLLTTDESLLRAQVVVSTPAVRSQFGSRLDSLYAPSVIAEFGSAPDQVAVQVVAPAGPAAYLAALQQDAAARKVAGAQLLANKRITETPQARAQLAGGEVDSRLLITLSALAAVHPVNILAFGDTGPGASAGVPLASAELSGSGQAAGLTDARYLGWLTAFFQAQPAPYASRIVMVQQGGQPAMQVEFSSPSPLGLLAHALPARASGDRSVDRK